MNFVIQTLCLILSVWVVWVYRMKSFFWGILLRSWRAVGIRNLLIFIGRPQSCMHFIINLVVFFMKYVFFFQQRFWIVIVVSWNKFEICGEIRVSQSKFRRKTLDYSSRRMFEVLESTDFRLISWNLHFQQDTNTHSILRVIIKAIPTKNKQIDSIIIWILVQIGQYRSKAIAAPSAHHISIYQFLVNSEYIRYMRNYTPNVQCLPNYKVLGRNGVYYYMAKNEC